MTPGEQVNEQVRRLITEPGREIGRLARVVQFQIRLWRFCAGRLHRNNLLAMAAALSFRTIFALIPTLVLAFLAAGSLGVVENSKRSLRQFLEASGFSEIAAVQEPEATTSKPASEPGAALKFINVADEIEKIVSGMTDKLTFQRIGPIGAALFIWTALSLLTTMEDSLNRVFGAARSRAMVRRVLLYWSTMTLGPIALAVAIFLGQRAIAAVEHAPGVAWVVVALSWIGPTVVGVLVLAAIYILLPNTHVNRHAAVGGALAAVLLWLIARWGFAVYVDRFVVKGNLYGILGVFPLFLMWLNFSWMIFLFGAELAHTAAHLNQMRNGIEDDRMILSQPDALAATLVVARGYESGKGATPMRQLERALPLPANCVRWLVEQLVTAGVLCRVDDDREEQYVLSRPSAQLPVRDVLRACAGERDETGANGAPRNDHELASAFTAELNDRVRDVTIADLLARGKEPRR